MPYYTTDELLDEVKDRETNGPTNHARKAVWADLEALNRGDWGEVFRTRSGKPELTAGELFTGNLFRRTIEDGGYLFREQKPAEMVDAESDNKKASAERRERAIHAYNNLSNIWNYAELFGQDMVAAGMAVIRVWPEFGKPASERFPLFHRVNPRTVLLPRNWTMDRATDDVVLNYIRPIKELRREFPEETAQLLETYQQKRGQKAPLPTTAQVVDYYATDYICRDMFVLEERSTSWWERMTNAGGKPPPRDAVAAVRMLEMENDTGKCAIQIAARKNWSQIPMGVLDDSRGIARLRNRYWRILLDHWIQMVYGPTLVWNVKNPKPDNPVWLALSPDAKAERIGSENASWQVGDILDRLEQQERTSKIAPAAREGDVELNKATAAFLSKAQGHLYSFVRSNQQAFADAKQLANEAAMAQDEKWCRANKQVTGRARGRRFAMSYNPKTFKGDYSNRVDYGLWAGANQAEAQILMLQKVGKGLSWETFMERDPDIEDVPLEQKKLYRERMRESIFAQLEVEQDIKRRFQLLKVLDDLVDKDMALSDVIEKLHQEFVLVPEPQPALGAGLPALGAGESEPPPVGAPTGMPGVEQPVVLPSREELKRMVLIR